MKLPGRLPFAFALGVLLARAPSAVAQLPDITAVGGVKIGSQSAPWGGGISLSDSDAIVESGGKCAFDFHYAMVNNGNVSTNPKFTNRLRRGATVISQQTLLALHPGETQKIATQGYLSPGGQSVTLTLDDGNLVKESNEDNNQFGVKVVVNSKCLGKTPTPAILKPQAVTPLQAITPQQITAVPIITPQAVTPGRRVSAQALTPVRASTRRPVSPTP